MQTSRISPQKGVYNFEGTDYRVSLKKYMQTVGTHFKGKVTAWDMVGPLIMS